MLANLSGVTERQELRDDTGTLIGYFDPTPVANPDAVPGGWGAFTAEEVAEAVAAAKAGRSGQGRTLDEIYKEFGHL